MQKRSRWGRSALLFLLLSLLLLYIAFTRIPLLALGVDRLVGAPLRTALSRVAGAVSFSLTEWLLLSLPLVVLLSIPLALFSARSRAATRRAVAILLVPAVCVAGLYVLTFATGRHTPPIEERLALPVAPSPTGEEVIATATWLTSLSKAPPSYPGDREAEALLCRAYTAAGERYGFFANTAVAVKPTATPLLLRLGYFGLYAFPLGEVTLASECPPSSRTFTLAHEMAHASGFAREEEADLVALLAALLSYDPYLISSVAEGILGRFLSCLAVDAPALWRQVSGGLSDAAREGLSRAGEVYEGGQAAEALAAEAPDYSRTVLLTVALYRRLSSQEGGGASIL